MIHEYFDLDPSARLGLQNAKILHVEAHGEREQRVFLFDDAVLAVGTCFACGRKLSSSKAKVPSAESAEHVISMWIQREFGLSEQLLTLPNGTTIRYKELKIPLCQACNNGPYSAMEHDIKTAVAQGADAVRRLNPATMYAWFAKLFLGLLRKDTLLAASIKDPAGPRMIAPGELDAFRLMHALMQYPRVRMQLRWSPSIVSPALKNPLASLLVYRLQGLPPDQPKFFDFRDATNLGTIAIALGEVGIIAALKDGGLVQATLPDRFDLLEDVPLHPMQFRELVADVFDRARRVNLRPHYSFGPLTTPAGLVLPGVEVRLEKFERRDGTVDAPLVDFDQSIYVALLAKHTGLPRDVLIDANGRPRTLLFTTDTDGKLQPKHVSANAGF
jgi:hypothetical protein